MRPEGVEEEHDVDQKKGLQKNVNNICQTSATSPLQLCKSQELYLCFSLLIPKDRKYSQKHGTNTKLQFADGEFLS